MSGENLGCSSLLTILGVLALIGYLDIGTRIFGENGFTIASPIIICTLGLGVVVIGWMFIATVFRR